MPERAALVTALILDRPTCLRCIGVRSSMSAGDLDRTIGAMERSLVVRRAADRCRACGVTDTTLSVDRPAV